MFQGRDRGRDWNHNRARATGSFLNGASWSVHLVPSKYRWVLAPPGSGYQPGDGSGAVMVFPT